MDSNLCAAKKEEELEHQLVQPNIKKFAYKRNRSIEILPKSVN